jgi:hypothetical protein
MHAMKVPNDLLAWEEVDHEALKNMQMTIQKRDDYRKTRLLETRDNPDCRYLRDIETKLHHYVETEGDQTAHIGSDDEEDES